MRVCSDHPSASSLAGRPHLLTVKMAKGASPSAGTDHSAERLSSLHPPGSALQILASRALSQLTPAARCFPSGAPFSIRPQGLPLQCSAKCGRGVRRRTVACIDLTTNATVASSRCDAASRPVDEHKCRVMHCPRWRGTPWSAVCLFLFSSRSLSS